VPDAIWEVFRQERRGQAFQHAGSFHAPDRAFAEVYARAFYSRRHESDALWIVPRDQLVPVATDENGFDTSYRRVDGYSIKVRLREARERAGTTQAS
jgi:phenylacetate-CoA oxygenase PaaH subunit